MASKVAVWTRCCGVRVFVELLEKENLKEFQFRVNEEIVEAIQLKKFSGHNPCSLHEAALRCLIRAGFCQEPKKETEEMKTLFAKHSYLNSVYLYELKEKSDSIPSSSCSEDDEEQEEEEEGIRKTNKKKSKKQVNKKEEEKFSLKIDSEEIWSKWVSSPTKSSFLVLQRPQRSVAVLEREVVALKQYIEAKEKEKSNFPLYEEKQENFSLNSLPFVQAELLEISKKLSDETKEWEAKIETMKQQFTKERKEAEEKFKSLEQKYLSQKRETDVQIEIAVASTNSVAILTGQVAELEKENLRLRKLQLKKTRKHKKKLTNQSKEKKTLTSHQMMQINKCVPEQVKMRIRKDAPVLFCVERALPLEDGVLQTTISYYPGRYKEVSEAGVCVRFLNKEHGTKIIHWSEVHNLSLTGDYEIQETITVETKTRTQPNEEDNEMLEEKFQKILTNKIQEGAQILFPYDEESGSSTMFPGRISSVSSLGIGVVIDNGDEKYFSWGDSDAEKLVVLGGVWQGLKDSKTFQAKHIILPEEDEEEVSWEDAD